jgi:hypothetical protein
VLVPDGMSLFDAYGHADGAVGLLLGRGVDGYGWQYTMLAGPEPRHLPVLTLAKPPFDGVSAVAVWFAGNAPVRRVDVTAANVHGRFRAAADGGVDLLLTAHYDGVGDLPGIRQPGAADNGSGVAPLRAAPVASDNRRYGAAGLPAVGIGAGMAGYHSPADTADRIGAATLTAVARLVVATGWLAAAVPDNLSSLIGDKR